MDHSEVTISTATPTQTGSTMFVDLPLELYEAIFMHLCADWKGRTPNIIKALRPNKKLYLEALRIFYRHNTYVFHRENNWSFGDMTKDAVATIEKVRIYISHGILHTGLWKLGVPQEVETSLTPTSQARISDATNIRSVILDFDMWRPIDEDLVPFVSHGGVTYSFNLFLSDFHTLKRVELGLGYRIFAGKEEDLLRQKRLSDSIELGNSRFGTGAKLSTVTAIHIPEDAPEGLEFEANWFWKADEGCFLTLKKRSTNGKSSGITTWAM